MKLPIALKQAIESELGLEILAAHELGGGCIHRAMRLETSDGMLFCKFNQADQAANFAAEAEGLSRLAKSQTLRVPEVRSRLRGGEHAALLLEFIDTGSECPEFWETLGTGLAALHRCSSAAFGLDQDNFIGSLPQANGWEADFDQFWLSRRLQPLLERAWPQLDDRDRLQASRLLDKLSDLLVAEAPALLHGDLWRGNLMTDAQGQPCLIDPAVHFGHREAELAFTRLFGGFAPAFYACYQDEFPLLDGWRERVDLFNLYPLLVHLVLFGPSYLRQVQAVLRRFG